jgi:hypothetical protein
MITKSILLYKTFSFNENKVWGTYDVEFNGNKARVKSTDVFIIREYSRWNKLTSLGGTSGGGKPDTRTYSLMVNGHQVFFNTDYLIPSV